MTDAVKRIQGTASSAASVASGHASNARLVLWAFAGLVVGMTGLGVGLVWIAIQKPGVPSLVVLACYCILEGAMLGAIVVALRGRVVRIEWDDEGVTFRVGWYRVKVVRWLWSDPVQARLFLGASRERRRPFLLVLRMGCEEVRVDSQHASWEGIRPFVTMLRQRVPVEEAQLTAKLIDQGPSLRQDVFAIRVWRLTEMYDAVGNRLWTEALKKNEKK